MKRHKTDYLALFSGLLFAALGVGFLLDGVDAWDVDITWVPAIMLIALGLGGVLASIDRRDAS